MLFISTAPISTVAPYFSIVKQQYILLPIIRKNGWLHETVEIVEEG